MSEDGSQLDRITVNLPPRASRALHHLVESTEYNKTDVVIRALLIYQHLNQTWEKGGRVIVEVDGERIELRVL